MNAINFNGTKYLAEEFSDAKIDLLRTETSEQTIRRLLASYEIGRKLKQLRLRKKVALVDLGKHTGLSASMLSQLENGKAQPTLPTLARIASVFDVGLDHFFTVKRGKSLFSVVKQAERIRFPDRPGVPKPSYFFECLAFAALDKGLQAYLAEFPSHPAGDFSLHFHEGAEFLHVLEGKLAIFHDGEEHALEAGDSAYFDAIEPHGYRGVSRKPARAFVVTTPPRL